MSVSALCPADGSAAGPPADEIELCLLLSNPCLEVDQLPRVRELMGLRPDWHRVLGFLLVHRTAGIAWWNVREYRLGEQSSFPPSQLFRPLELLFDAQRAAALAQNRQNAQLLDTLERAGVQSAILKGSGVAALAFPDPGMRYFNDNDVLVDRAALPEVGQIMRQLDYVQGWWDPSRRRVRPASRSEALRHSLLSHETCPYVKPVDEAGLDRHTVDVHFSLDLLTPNRTDDLVRDVLAGRVRVSAGSPIWTLQPVDAFVFACCHFQREATQVHEVERLKDLQLYKLADLVALLHGGRSTVEPTEVVARAERLGFTGEVRFALGYLDALYPDQVPAGLMSALAPPSGLELNELYDGGRRVGAWREPSIVSRLFDSQRRPELTAAEHRPA